MARTKLAYTLPSLGSASLTSDRVLSDARILDILRELAVNNRRAESQPFYPVREAASQLRAPVSAVSRAYTQLKSEGLLSGIRGSRTELRGCAEGRSLHFKSLVAIPVQFCRFVSLDYRKFYRQIQLALHFHGFGSQIVFYGGGDRGLEELRESFETTVFDVAIWLLPHASARATILRLQDRGIRVIVISDGRPSRIECQYEIRREAALENLFQMWRKKFHTTAVRFVKVQKRFYAFEEMIHHLAGHAGLRCSEIEVSEHDVARSIFSLCDEPNRGVVLPGDCAALFSQREPRSFVKLLKACHVALADGPVPFVVNIVPPASVDLIVVDWYQVGDSIVRDMIHNRQAGAPLKVIAAALIASAPLHAYAETI